MYFIY